MSPLVSAATVWSSAKISVSPPTIQAPRPPASSFSLINTALLAAFEAARNALPNGFPSPRGRAFKIPLSRRYARTVDSTISSSSRFDRGSGYEVWSMVRGYCSYSSA